MIGEVVGGYRVLEALSGADASGMGRVYLAEHVRNGRKAVLKQLRLEGAQEKIANELAERFFREARAAATIDDPDIVQIFDSGRHTDGSYYIIMEKLSGESLAMRLAREGTLPPPAAVALTRLIARVLAVVHAKNVVHRDLKPANIYLVPDPHVGLRTKILDFGIAKIKDGASALTATEGGFGTAPYMSPEQFQKAASADIPADIYALGCILFEMLIGRVPYQGPSLFEFMHQHCLEPVPVPSQLDARLLPFDPIIAKALAKNAKDRYQTMAELTTALAALRLGDDSGEWRRQAAAGAIVSGRTPDSASTLSNVAGQTYAPVKKRRGLVAGLGIGAVLAAGAVAAYLVIPHGPPAPVALALDAGAAPRPAAVTVIAAPDAAPRALPDAAPAPRPTPAVPANRWVHVELPVIPVVLGVDARAPAAVSGFRPDRHVVSPSQPYELQQHEVTWGELEPWLAANPQAGVELPLWSAARRDLPATGIPWLSARAYCQSLGPRVHLPTEEQWELAARGAELRPYPWGDAPLDTSRTRAYLDTAALPVAVMTSDQDRTPEGIYDLMGNAREWTADLYRPDRRGEDASWVGNGDKGYRAVRGLPIMRPGPKATAPAEGAAARAALCTWECAANAKEQQMFVGFRCAREVE